MLRIVTAGGAVSLPGVTSYTHSSTGSGSVRTLRAAGVGSVLDLSNVTTIVNGEQVSARVDIEALWGGQVDLGSVTAITDPTSGDTRGRSVDVLAQGVGSQVDLSSLTIFQDSNGDLYSTLSVNHLGEIVLGDVTLGTQRIDVLEQ